MPAAGPGSMIWNVSRQGPGMGACFGFRPGRRGLLFESQKDVCRPRVSHGAGAAAAIFKVTRRREGGA